ncbi:unnamed protein product [Agarophyton chilense]
MSGVATLKLRGAKRHFDEMSVDIPPQACSPSRFVIRPPPLKRGRCTPSSFTSPSRPPKVYHQHSVQPVSTTQSLPAPSSSHPPSSASSSSSPTPSSSSAKEKLSDQELAALAKHVPKRLKKVVDKLANGQIALSQTLFTVHDLRDICHSVLSEKEATMNNEFAKVLNDRLAQQFRDFTKFNEDYVTRQFRGKDYTYLS